MKRQLSSSSTALACLFLLLASAFAVNAQALSPKVTLEAGTPMPAQTRVEAIISETDDPTAIFRNRAVFFRGWQQGGSNVQLEGAYLVYRFRIEFPRVVRVSSISVRGAGHQGDNAQIRLMDERGKVLASQRTEGFNVLSTTHFPTENAVGKVFFLEEYDYSSHYRYRDRVEFSIQPVN